MHCVYEAFAGTALIRRKMQVVLKPGFHCTNEQGQRTGWYVCWPCCVSPQYFRAAFKKLVSKFFLCVNFDKADYFVVILCLYSLIIASLPNEIYSTIDEVMVYNCPFYHHWFQREHSHAVLLWCTRIELCKVFILRTEGSTKHFILFHFTLYWVIVFL